MNDNLQSQDGASVAMGEGSSTKEKPLSLSPFAEAVLLNVMNHKIESDENNVDLEKLLIQRIQSSGAVGPQRFQDIMDMPYEAYVPEIPEDIEYEYPAVDLRLGILADAFLESFTPDQQAIILADLFDGREEDILEPLNLPIFLAENRFSSEGLRAFLAHFEAESEKVLLLAMLVGREYKFSIYSNPQQPERVYRDVAPRAGSYGAVSVDRQFAQAGIQYRNIFSIHTHQQVDIYDLAQNRFLYVDGFSANPIDFNNDDDDEAIFGGQSDWYVFLANIGEGKTYEAVMSSNQEVTIVELSFPQDLQVVADRIRHVTGENFDVDMLKMLETPGGVMTDVIVKHLLSDIHRSVGWELMDEAICFIFGFPLYKYKNSQLFEVNTDFPEEGVYA